MATFVEIRDGVRLETRRYGDPTSSRALVVWGHGLCNSMAGEDEDMLWNFWHDDGAVAMDAHVVRYSARGHGESSPSTAPEDCAWDTLGGDMLALARACRRDSSQRLVLVIVPTFHETRRRRRSQILAAAERGFGAFLKSKKPRPIFKGTDREDEPPRLVGVREDSFEHVMAASADSDLPPPDVIANALRDVPILALCWDCGDRTHPASSAEAIETQLAPHADVRVAETLEETRGWSEAVRAFVSGLGAGE